MRYRLDYITYLLPAQIVEIYMYTARAWPFAHLGCSAAYSSMQGLSLSLLHFNSSCAKQYIPHLSAPQCIMWMHGS